LIKTNQLPTDVQDVILDDERLAALRLNAERDDLGIPELDIITSMISRDFDAKIALVSLVYDDIQQFQSCFGLNETQTPVEHSFCAHAIAQEVPKPFLVLDASKDARFSNNPLVTNSPAIRFYAGMPIVINNQKLGTLCVIDDKPRDAISNHLLERLEKYTSLVNNILLSRTHARMRVIEENKRISEFQRQQMALRASNVVAWVWDLESNMVDCDYEIRELFDIRHENPVTADDIFSAIHRDDADMVEGHINSIMITDDEFNAEFRIPSNKKWLLGQGRVLGRDENGKALQIAGVNIDITDQKHAEEKTNLLLRELNHRVKNTLAMLQSIANQTLKNSKTPDEFKKAFSGRIRSLAAAHTLLSDKEWEPIDLYKLLRDQVNVYVDDIDKQLVIVGDEATLGPEEALALGMVLHELATNAAKYGAISVPGGHVEISVHVSELDKQEKLNLKWREIGGPTVITPKTTGFGSIMIKRSLDKIIGSSVHLDYLPDGVEAQITVPLNKK